MARALTRTSPQGFTLSPDIGRVTPGSNQIDHLAPEFQRIGRTVVRHLDTSCESIGGVH